VAAGIHSSIVDAKQLKFQLTPSHNIDHHCLTHAHETVRHQAAIYKVAPSTYQRDGCMQQCTLYECTLYESSINKQSSSLCMSALNVLFVFILFHIK
jgi:hypothetical protein